MAGVISMRAKYVGYVMNSGIKVTAPDTEIIKPVHDDRMSQYQECKESMILPGHGKLDDYRDGDRILTIADLNVLFIHNNRERFYWNFFDGLYIDINVACWARPDINLDNLKFNERNIDCLRYVYPDLTARARLFGGKALAEVLRHYELKYYLDKDKLACQLEGATAEFMEEFGITAEMTRPAVIDGGISNFEQVRVVTLHNLDLVTEFLKVRFSSDNIFDVKECTEDGLVTIVGIDIVHVVREDDTINIYGDGILLTSIIPGDCINIESRKNTYVIKSAIDGSLAHFLKFTK